MQLVTHMQIGDAKAPKTLHYRKIDVPSLFLSSSVHLSSYPLRRHIQVHRKQHDTRRRNMHANGREMSRRESLGAKGAQNNKFPSRTDHGGTAVV